MSLVCFLYYKYGFICLNLDIYHILEGQMNIVHNTNRFQANLICVFDHFSWLYTKRMTGCWRLNIFFFNAGTLSPHFKLFQARHTVLTQRSQWSWKDCGKCQIYGSRDEVVDGFVVCMVFCFVCMCLFFSLSVSDRNSALPTFWRPPRKTEGSCILYFPWDLMKYTALGSFQFGLSDC